MNRKYIRRKNTKNVNILRKNIFTHPAMTTDVIVGFPGETEEEFERDKGIFKSIHFYETHIFKYSDGKEPVQAVMEHQVPEQIKTKKQCPAAELGKKTQGIPRILWEKEVEVFEEDGNRIEKTCTYWIYQRIYENH